ncbi:hypothetical protein PF005_g6383 [Phytophthora fragariae]|uniref:Uncharacterized protein n=1 Tax=Phytophthora fragariae TaxID=53985 RepID=A0A6A4A1Z8_9STRA|nr:hypothetical protein PF003_g33183 [Phytophthora fragariae]KAE8943293.1 hypothetical protein PF009_g6980 [Phytophthora fragariae]KAE9124966.1 hypothetical protein PF007_g6529 [Phytophthora fragariae]KAE9149661.1 hypothetical protein PF006_g5869 [Phytophthora fragariae]KAE9223239.1 hypothetical protein PF005_g6383 [Phytophthora fragariae]
MKYWQSVSLKRIFKLIWVFCLLLCVCGGVNRTVLRKDHRRKQNAPFGREMVNILVAELRGPWPCRAPGRTAAVRCCHRTLRDARGSSNLGSPLSSLCATPDT